MAQYRFLKAMVCLGIVLALVHVYQHNRVIKLSYEKQRIEQLKQKLTKKKSEILVEFSQAKNPQEIKRWAQRERAMSMTQLSQVTTLTTRGPYDFFLMGTTNSENVMMR